MSERKKIFEAKDLRKIYGEGDAATTALENVSFSIHKGEFLAIMGPSGSGKSTLLHILGFLDHPTSGELIFEGRHIEDFSDEELAKLRNRKLGFVFQAFHLLPRISVLENVKIPLLYSGIKESRWDEIAKKAIKDVGLAHRMDHEPSELSGGEKQRVAIARALVNDPEIIFADEPTGNLDSKSGQAIMEILQDLNEKDDRTIILITHETYTADHAERIIRIHDGEIVEDEKVKNRRSAKSDFLK